MLVVAFAATPMICEKYSLAKLSGSDAFCVWVCACANTHKLINSIAATSFFALIKTAFLYNHNPAENLAVR